MLVRLYLSQGLWLECEVGVQGGLRRLDRFMTEPQRDHGAVNVRLQQLQCSAGPQHVRRYPLGGQWTASLAGGTHLLGQERLDAVGTEPPPVHVGEQCARSPPRRLLEPCLESDPNVRGQRRTSFLPPFADASHTGASAEMDGVPVEADQLGESQASLGRE